MAPALPLRGERRQPEGRRRVVVTPGMVELGREQRTANETFARQAAAIATDVLIVGRANRYALQRGAQTGSARIVTCKNRTDAVRMGST